MRVLSYRGDDWSSDNVETLPAVLERIEEDTLTWVRAGGLDTAGLAELGEAFGLHPLTIEDVQTARQRPKVEDYPGMTFVILRVPRFKDDELTWQQVGLFLGEDFLVTASTEPVMELDDLERRLLRRGLPDDRGSVDNLLHQAVDILVDAWFPYMDILEDRIEEIEDEVLEDPSRERLHDIRTLKGVVSRTRKVSGPMREAMQSLERVEHPNILPATRLYLRDVADHMIRIAERLEHVKEMTLIAQESWNASLANSQNQVMKVLTVVATIFIPLTFVAGIYGMNFAYMPELEWRYGYVAAWALMIAIGGGMLVAFRRRGWL